MSWRARILLVVVPVALVVLLVWMAQPAGQAGSPDTVCCPAPRSLP